jgi:surfactin synthase thioesterase subunit
MGEKITLLCLTFAGGNKYSYRHLSENAPSNIRIITLEYPGRGSRMNERLISEMGMLVNDLYDQVKEIADKTRYAIYGHSLGGLTAYLLTLKLLENRHREPEHLFITGTTGPSSTSRAEKKRSLLPKAEFIKEIKELGGMPEEILESEEMLDFLEPILRNDFGVSERYRYQERGALDIPLTIITGSEEDMEREEILLWQKESNHPVDFRQMPGGHFFILEHTGQLMEVISKKLTRK